MDRELLRQYDALREEQKDLRRRIEQSERDLKRLSGEVVSDTVMGSREDLTIGPIKVTGKPGKIYGALSDVQRRRKEKLQTSLQKTETLQFEIEDFIYTVPDARIRTILRMRYLDDKTWEAVSRHFGKSKAWAQTTVNNYFSTDH